MESLGTGRLPNKRGGEDNQALATAMLGDFCGNLSTTSVTLAWETEKAWNDALVRHGGARPATLAGIDGLSEISWFLDQLLPFELHFDFVLKDEEHALQVKSQIASSMDRFLKEAGY